MKIPIQESEKEMKKFIFVQFVCNRPLEISLCLKVWIHSQVIMVIQGCQKEPAAAAMRQLLGVPAAGYL